MPFDCTALDTATQFLLELRDRLTPENWRPHAVDYREFQEGRGCVIQQYQYLMRQPRYRVFPAAEVQDLHKRLKNAVGCRRFYALARFNDSHTLDEVRALVDRAIAG
jgi:hypothetical protein